MPRLVVVKEIAFIWGGHVEVENGGAGIVAVALGVGDAVVWSQHAGSQAALVIAAAKTLAVAHGGQGGPAGQTQECARNNLVHDCLVNGVLMGKAPAKSTS